MFKIFVKVKPKALEEKVMKLSETNFKVHVREPAEKGRANRALIRVLADHFKTTQSGIRLVSGSTSKIKIIEIDN
jgi:hypothetical protein